MRPSQSSGFRFPFEFFALGRDGSPSRPFADRDTHVDRLNVLGRDGSPSRPFADGVADVVRLNGGLGEPRPTPRPPPIIRSPFEPFAFGRAAIAMAAVRRSSCESPGIVFDPSHVGPPTDVMAITSLPKAERLFGSQVSALMFLVQVFRCRSRAPNPNLLTRTRLPIAETRDLKMCAPANPPVSGFPLLDCVPNRQPLTANRCLT